MKTRSMLVASALLFFSFARLHAQVVMVSNLGAATDSSDPATFSVWQAATFTTDNSAPSFTLNSLTLKLGTVNNAGGNFFVALYSDVTDQPGSLIGTLAGSSNPAGFGNFTYTASGITLSPNTSYWAIAGVSSGAGSYEWFFTFTGTTDTWTIEDAVFGSGNQGATWTGPFTEPFQFSVTATAIPEPGAWSTAAATMAFFIARLRRKFPIHSA